MIIRLLLCSNFFDFLHPKVYSFGANFMSFTIYPSLRKIRGLFCVFAFNRTCIRGIMKKIEN